MFAKWITSSSLENANNQSSHLQKLGMGIEPIFNGDFVRTIFFFFPFGFFTLPSSAEFRKI
jgi:hypothetical protein